MAESYGGVASGNEVDLASGDLVNSFELRRTARRDAAHVEPTGARDVRCRRCGYQLATEPPHPVCPMCKTSAWELVGAAHQRQPL
jgi:rubrerythrin